jgi:hypothetical protein
MTNQTKVADISQLADHVGKTVTVYGKISNVPWQHILAGDTSYRYSYYFDVGSSQTVIYAQEKIDCSLLLSVTGKVIEVKSTSNKTGSDYREFHILVDSWFCR